MGRKAAVAASSVLAVVVLGTSVTADAASLVVSSSSDSGPGSLRDAIAVANSNAEADTITFDPSVTGTITLASGELAITSDIDLRDPARTF